MLKKIFIVILSLISQQAANAQIKGKVASQIRVSTDREVYGALKKLKPGDELLFSDGTYRDLKLVIISSGTKELPITIKAKNPGKVFITGDSKVELRGEHLVFEGFYFKDGSRDVNKWKSHGPGLVAIYGSYNRVTSCVFDCFDDANSAYITTSLSEDGKVPQYCRIDHCVFTDKITFDQVINLNNTFKAVKDGSAGGPPMYHRIDHCFFSNPRKPGNAGGGIRIGYYRNDAGRCLVDSNLFMRQDSEAEIITSKSQENVYYGNTFLNCQGTMNFRHGDKQVAVNNFHIGTDRKYEYGGMFVWGSLHIIASNYFELSGTIKSRGSAALYLNPGPEASEHALAFNSLIVNNTFVNINGYAIHFNPLDDRRKEFSRASNLKFDTPNHLIFKGNIFYSDQKVNFPFFKYDYETKTNVWENNIAFGQSTGIEPVKGLIEKRFRMKRNREGIYTSSKESSFTVSKMANIGPIEGIPLDLKRLVNQGVKGKPLNWEDVRPYWLKEIPGTYAKNGKLSSERAAKFKEVIDRNKE